MEKKPRRPKKDRVKRAYVKIEYTKGNIYKKVYFDGGDPHTILDRDNYAVAYYEVQIAQNIADHLNSTYPELKCSVATPEEFKKDKTEINNPQV